MRQIPRQTLRKALLLFALLSLLYVPSCAAQTQAKPTSPSPLSGPSAPAHQDAIQTKVDNFLRNYYAWGPEYDVVAGPEKPSPVPDLIEMPVTVSMGSASDTATVYVSKDGNYIVRGDLSNLNVDPFAQVREQLHPDGWPSEGPADSKVVLVEYADFECPSCRALDVILRDFLAKNPNVRLVYKYFPLTSIHPWAMTAAIAAQCVYRQNPQAFWKVHDEIYDQQDAINNENAQDKLADFAQQAGINMDAYKTCLADPATTSRIDESIAEGHQLNIDSTPTIFVNGRRIVGASDTLLQQLTQYELTKQHNIP